MASAKRPKERSNTARACIGLWKIIQTISASMQGEHLEGLGTLARVKEDEVGAPPAAADHAEDPLAFHAEAIPYTLPLELRGIAASPEEAAALDLGGADSVGDYLNRVWTTALCVAWLEDQSYCWQSDPVEEVTIVDKGTAWLLQQAERNKAVGRVLKAVEEKARYRVAVWFIVQDERITRVRRATMTFKFHTSNLLMRMTAFVGHALRIKHEFISCFFGPLLFEGFRKWQRWVLVFTCIMVAFVIEVWFYWNKGTLCCAEIRAILECEGTYLDPCRRVTPCTHQLPYTHAAAASPSARVTAVFG